MSAIDAVDGASTGIAMGQSVVVIQEQRTSVIGTKGTLFVIVRWVCIVVLNGHDTVCRRQSGFVKKCPSGPTQLDYQKTKIRAYFGSLITQELHGEDNVVTEKIS